MNWFSGSIPDAIAEAKRNNKIFLVFIEGNDDMSKKMMVTYNDPVVTKKLSSSNVVALKLVANSQPYLLFSAIFPVLVIPSSFFIGKNGAPVEIITGNLDPSDFLNKIDRVFEIHENDCANASTQRNMNEQSSKSLGEPSTSSNSVSDSTGFIASSDVPSTSQTVNSVSGELPETSQALQERIQRAKSLVEIQRKNKEAEEKENARKEELERREAGKAMQKAQKTKQEAELGEWARNLAKEREEERLAREKVCAQIAQDKAERAAKYQHVKDTEQAQREKVAHMGEEHDRAARTAATSSGEAHLQSRLPDGSLTSHTSSDDSTLDEESKKDLGYVGNEMQQPQKTKQETELEEWARSRAKEREEERLAREKVRAQIAQDRAERAAKYQQVKEAEQAEREKMAHMREEQDRAARNAAMRSNETRLQFRLPDGSFSSHAFSDDSTLDEARQFVTDEIRPPFSNFTLCTTFPRRHFTESNYSETLRDLQLAPSAVLLILPAQAVTSINQDGFLVNIFWMLVSPFTTIWRFLTSFFPGNPPRPVPTPPTATVEGQQQPNSRKNNQTGATSDGQAAHQRRGPNFYKREGNVFRINNQSDDDDNNTWNGNSTQQM